MVRQTIRLPIVIVETSGDRPIGLDFYPTRSDAEAGVEAWMFGHEAEEFELYDAKARRLGCRIIDEFQWELLPPESGQPDHEALERRLWQWYEHVEDVDASSMSYDQLLCDACVRYRFDACNEPMWKAVPKVLLQLPFALVWGLWRLLRGLARRSWKWITRN